MTSEEQVVRAIEDSIRASHAKIVRELSMDGEPKTWPAIARGVWSNGTSEQLALLSSLGGEIAALEDIAKMLRLPLSAEVQALCAWRQVSEPVEGFLG